MAGAACAAPALAVRAAASPRVAAAARAAVENVRIEVRPSVRESVLSVRARRYPALGERSKAFVQVHELVR
ncbi:hypothetical protein GCM10023147_13010 [Tsukamurella soli]|uniref:Uncharacterized protein n=1 Tax=Tsukamurella soli TaxID=644556 RepID=A0ABP8JAU2_9ACTN